MKNQFVHVFQKFLSFENLYVLEIRKLFLLMHGRNFDFSKNTVSYPSLFQNACFYFFQLFPNLFFFAFLPYYLQQMCLCVHISSLCQNPKCKMVVSVIHQSTRFHRGVLFFLLCLPFGILAQTSFPQNRVMKPYLLMSHRNFSRFSVQYD